MSSAGYSCRLFKPIFAYRQTAWTLIRLLLKEQSDLGPQCLQKWLLKSQAGDKADDNSCDWHFIFLSHESTHYLIHFEKNIPSNMVRVAWDFYSHEISLWDFYSQDLSLSLFLSLSLSPCCKCMIINIHVALYEIWEYLFLLTEAPLMLSILGKIFSIQHTKIFF